MLDISCRQCGAIYHSDLAHLGKRLRCTQCGSIIVIEKPQSATVPLKPNDLHDPQPRRHSQDGSVSATARKSRFRRAIYLGASALIVCSLGGWWWHTRPQKPVVDQRGQLVSGITQQTKIHEGRPEQSNTTARATPSDIERGVVSNPFGTMPEAQTDQSHTTSSDSANPRPKHYHSLPSGTRPSDDTGISGHGKLSISNRTDLDAVARLYDRSTLETRTMVLCQGQ